MHRKLLLPLGLVGCSLMMGCTTTSVKEQDVVLVQPEQNAMVEIKHIAAEARDELRLLAKYQESLALESLSQEQHEQKFMQATYIPPGFEQEVDLYVTDSAFKVAQAIAAFAGYDLDPQGVPSYKEPDVTINQAGLPLNEALKELSSQVGDLITIEVYPATKLMVFKYNTGY